MRHQSVPREGLLLLLLLLGAGCSSIRSEFISRDECNLGWEVRRLKGIPITVSVPTHVRVSIVETSFINTGTKTTVEARGRDVFHELVYTKKIFTVDPKRPPAGYLKYNMALTDDQYLKTLGSELQDTTIADVSLALQRVLPLLKRPSGKTNDNTFSEQSKDARLLPVKSVVAVGLFEIDDPVFEQNVQGFLDCNLMAAGRKMGSHPAEQAALEPMAPPSIPPAESAETTASPPILPANSPPL